jgi:hypothetical protein
MEGSLILKQMFEERDIKNTQTIVTYTQAETRLKTLHSGPDYWVRSEVGWKKLLGDSTYALATKLQMLSLLIMVRRIDTRPTELLKKYREKLRAQIEEATRKSLPLLELPSYEEYFGSLCPSTPQKYIVNKLIELFGLRNLDMLMEMVQFKRGVPLPNVNRNFMVIQSRDIVLHIRKYKTAKTYGTKILRIVKKEHPALVRCINDYYDAGQRFLLSRKNGLEIQQSSLHRHVSHLTGDHGSGAIFKVVVDYHRENGGLNRLRELSKSRGTSLDTIVSSYNIE